MVQEILAMEENSASKTNLSLIFANVNAADIILKSKLDKLASKHENFYIHYVLNEVQLVLRSGGDCCQKPQISLFCVCGLAF